MTPGQLLTAAIEACEGDEFEVARRLGLSLDSAERQFYRWRAGVGPNFETTIRLLEIAELLRDRPKPSS